MDLLLSQQGDWSVEVIGNCWDDNVNANGGRNTGRGKREADDSSSGKKPIHFSVL